MNVTCYTIRSVFNRCRLKIVELETRNPQVTNGSERMSVRKDVKNRFTDISPRFFDVYSVCAHLIAEIGKEAVRSWSNSDIDEKMDQFVGQMVQNGFPKSQAILAWKLVVQGNSKFEPTLDQIPSLSVAAPIAPTTVAAAKDENVFSFEGGRWVVRFQGKTVYPNDVTGIKYLHCLISRSGEVIPARELYDDFGCRKRRKPNSAVNHLDAIASGLGTGVAKSDVLIDERGRKEMLHFDLKRSKQRWSLPSGFQMLT